MKFEFPIEGLYRAGIKDFRNGTLNYQYAFCTILKETAKSYFIELFESIGKKMPGDRLWVKKKNIMLSYCKEGKCLIYGIENFSSEICRACLRRCAEVAKSSPAIRSVIYNRKNHIS